MHLGLFRSRRTRSASSARLGTAFAAQGGAAAVEFAMVAPIVIMLLLEVFQGGIYFFYTAALEAASARAVRQIVVGTVANQPLTAATFRSKILCPNLEAPLSCANLITNLHTVAEAANPGGFYQFLSSDLMSIARPVMDNSQTSFCPGGGGAFVYMQTFYAMPVFSPFWLAFHSEAFNGSRVWFVSSYSVFRNEPFNSSGATVMSC